MAKVLEDITVEVKAKLSVDRRTAEACLKMVEMYANDNAEMIETKREKNGELSFHFSPDIDRYWEGEGNG